MWAWVFGWNWIPSITIKELVHAGKTWPRGHSFIRMSYCLPIFFFCCSFFMHDSTWFSNIYLLLKWTFYKKSLTRIPDFLLRCNLKNARKFQTVNLYDYSHSSTADSRHLSRIIFSIRTLCIIQKIEKILHWNRPEDISATTIHHLHLVKGFDREQHEIIATCEIPYNTSTAEK